MACTGVHAIEAHSIGWKIILVFAFATKSLREICEVEEEAVRRFGKKVTKTLKHRLADLEAAPTVVDLIAGRPQLQNPSGNYVIRLADECCLEFAANHIKNPVDEKGDIDWKKVSRIQIVRIRKCHD